MTTSRRIRGRESSGSSSAAETDGRVRGDAAPKRLALPIFASDALSSVAYATEAALSFSSRLRHRPLGAPAGLDRDRGAARDRDRLVPANGRVYESSGGAYIVAKDNLGTLPSLVGAAALLTDYVLTVAVSVAAGVVALVSAVPSLGAHGSASRSRSSP